MTDAPADTPADMPIGAGPDAHLRMPCDAEIDTSGLRCPLPVLRARRALRPMAPGQVLRMRATDMAALVDVPHYCQGAGHGLLASGLAGETLVFVIRRGPDQADCQGAVPDSAS